MSFLRIEIAESLHYVSRRFAFFVFASLETGSWSYERLVQINRFINNTDFKEDNFLWLSFLIIYTMTIIIAFII